MAEFFAAFRSPEDGAVKLETLHDLFIPEAVIVKIDDALPSVMSVDSFIEPRQALLNSGRLRGFSEKEISAVTNVFGGVAQRWCLYSKTGSLDGAPYDGWGRKAITLAHTPHGWRISAIAWQDGAEGSPPPLS